MPTRKLPGARTQRFAHPGRLGAERADHDVFDTPACRASGFAHRLVLDTPVLDAADAARWLALWREEHQGKGIPAAFLVWESRHRHEPSLLPGATLWVNRVLMFDQPLDPVPMGPGEALGAEDLDDIVTLMSEVDGESDPDWISYARWMTAGLLEQAAAGHGVVWGARDDDRSLVATLSLFHDAREARLQWIGTHPDHRRRGLCRGLLHRAVAAWQALSFGIVYVVVDPDAPAHAVYRRFGFRPVTWSHELSIPV